MLSLMYIGLHVKQTLFLPELIKLKFSRNIFEKNTQKSSFTNIRQLAAELLHADGRTDRQLTKLIVAFSNPFYELA